MSSSLAIFDPHDKGRSILLAMQGLHPDSDMQPITSGLDEELREAMDEDYGGIHATLIRLNGMGQRGRFEVKDSEVFYNSLEGIILAPTESQALFPPSEDNLSEWAQNERVFWAGLDGPICRSNNVKMPPEPNPGLSETQALELATRRRGSKACRECPMSRLTQDQAGNWVAPECKSSYNLLWWDSGLQDYAWVRVSGASVPALRKAFADVKRRGAPIQFAARLTWKSQEKGIRKFFVAALEFSPERLPDEVVAYALKRRKELLPKLEERVLETAHEGLPEEDRVPFAASDLAPAASAPAPAVKADPPIEKLAMAVGLRPNPTHNVHREAPAPLRQAAPGLSDDANFQSLASMIEAI